MIVAVMEISKTAEGVMAAGAIVLLAMATFGLYSLVFSQKRKAGRDPRAPKQRVTFVVEEAEEEPEETRKPAR